MLCVARSVIQLYGMLIITICGNKVLKYGAAKST